MIRRTNKMQKSRVGVVSGVGLRGGGGNKTKGGKAFHRMQTFQRMGWWTVTSLVPSGNVASTCTEWIISGMPDMH